MRRRRGALLRSRLRARAARADNNPRLCHRQLRTKMHAQTRTRKPIRSFSASCYGSPSARLLQYRPVSDWRQIQARIRKARTSADPPGQLSALYERTHDAMVAFELAQLYEKAGSAPEAIRWFTTAAERFRRPQWKQKAEEGLVRLGAPIPVAPAAVTGVTLSETTAEPVSRLEPIIAEFSEEQHQRNRGRDERRRTGIRF